MKLLTTRVLVFLVCTLIGLFASANKPTVSEPTYITERPIPVAIPSPEHQAEDQPRSGPTTGSKRCDDPKLKPIWDAIRRDKVVREALDNRSTPSDCREIFEISYVDLNRDGKKEILARSIDFPLCDAVGNCSLFALQKTNKGLRTLLHTTDDADATRMGGQIRQGRTNGYRDILTKGHFSAAETRYTTHRFDGRRYVEATCRFEVHRYDHRDRLVWEFISCSEFDRRLDLILKAND